MSCSRMVPSRSSVGLPLPESVKYSPGVAASRHFCRNRSLPCVCVVGERAVGGAIRILRKRDGEVDEVGQRLEQRLLRRVGAMEEAALLDVDGRVVVGDAALRSAWRRRKPVLMGPPAFDGVSRGPTTKRQVTASVQPSRWQVEQATQKFCVIGNAVEFARVEEALAEAQRRRHRIGAAERSMGSPSTVATASGRRAPDRGRRRCACCARPRRRGVPA